MNHALRRRQGSAFCTACYVMCELSYPRDVADSARLAALSITAAWYMYLRSKVLQLNEITIAVNVQQL